MVSVLLAGRAIRHSRDYASILLLDQRYLRANMRQKLPGWIASRLQAIDRFSPALTALQQVRVLLAEHWLLEARPDSTPAGACAADRALTASCPP